MVVIDERDRAKCFLIFTSFLSDEVVTDEVPQGFGPVSVLPTLNVSIEIVQQMMIQRHTKPHELFHGRPLLMKSTIC